MIPGKFWENQPVELHEPIQAALKSSQLSATILVAFDFASGAVRLTDRAVPIRDGKDGFKWHPAPRTAAVRDVAGGPTDWAPLRIYELTIPNELLEQFSEETGRFPDLDNKVEYHKRTVTMSLQLVRVATGPHGEDEPLGYPMVLHTGLMDKLDVSMTNNGVRYEMRAEGFLARKGVRGAGLVTDRDQKRRFPGDLGAEYVVEIEARPAVWPDY